MVGEIWKPVKGYEGIYEISNIGRVKSVDRSVKNGRGIRLVKGKILKQKTHKGYNAIDLHSEGSMVTKNIHQLVAISFLGHTPCGHMLVVDHIDNNSFNNRVENLQIITNRKNSSKDQKGRASIYVGVSKLGDKFTARISIKGVRHFLGAFENEIDAHKAYQNALKKISND